MKIVDKPSWSVYIGGTLIRVESGHFGIAHVLRNTDGPAKEDDLCLAHANLISASPAMYKALMDVSMIYDANCDSWFCPWCGARDKHRSTCARENALSQARGER